MEVSEGGSVDPDDPILFSAVVPVKLPVSMDLDGNITVPTNAIIVNKVDTKGIAVTDISIELDPEWNAASYEDDFSAKQDDSKDIAIKLRSDKLQADGSFTITSDDWKIPKASTIKLNMGVKIPKQTQLGDIGNIASIQYTLDWSGDDTTTGNGEGGSSWNGNATGEIPTPDPKPEPDPGDTELTVTFVAEGNGSLEGETTVVVNKGETAPFPTANPASIRYELSNWLDATTNSEVGPTTPIMADTTIKAVFGQRAASPKNWFTATNGTITGLSDEYLDMVDAPTDLVIPPNIGGSTIRAIGENAFLNKDLITSIVIPNTVTSIAANAFTGCSGLADMALPENVTTIGENAFLNCEKLNIEVNSCKNYIDFAPWGLNEYQIKWLQQNPEWDISPMTNASLRKVITLFPSTNRISKAPVHSGVFEDLALPSTIHGIKVNGIEPPDYSGAVVGFKNIRCESLTIPGSYESIVAPGVFTGSNLGEVTVADGIIFIGTETFYSCTFNHVNLPSSVESIASDAFERAHGIVNIDKEEGAISGAPWGGEDITVNWLR